MICAESLTFYCPSAFVFCSRARVSLFFFNDTATTEIYTLSLHDALPIYGRHRQTYSVRGRSKTARRGGGRGQRRRDRKSTPLNSSHLGISYAVFCLKKKQNIPCL